MKIDKLFPKVSDKVSFNLSKLDTIPKKSGCYILTNIDLDIIYIGQSSNIRKRVGQHLNCPIKTGKTKLGVVYYVFYIEYDKIKLNSLERGYLNMYQLYEGALPELNKKSGNI